MAYTTIDDPTSFFNTVLYSGSNSDQSITGVGFQPDWVWIKNRSSTPSHMLNDVVRGAGKQINSDNGNAELDRTYLKSFDSDGFSLEGNVSDYNQNSSNFVAWNWLAGGSASSNSDGSITSSVSANTTAGFSIVSWTGSNANATIGHGLSSAPEMIIFKNRSDASSWLTYLTIIGAGNFLRLNETNASASGSTPFNNTASTSSVFSVGANNDTNGSSDSMIAYCFSSVRGYSKIGSYTGNGNADGTFVYTGFKPAFVIFKETGVGNWLMKDNKRPTYNQNDQYFYANGSDSEFNNSVVGMDFLSNGFKCRGTAGDMNGNGTTVIYMTFAENPFVTSTGIPTTAR